MYQWFYKIFKKKSLVALQCGLEHNHNVMLILFHSLIVYLFHCKKCNYLKFIIRVEVRVNKKHIAYIIRSHRDKNVNKIENWFVVNENGNGLDPVHRSTWPIKMLTRIQKLYKTGHVTISQRISIGPKPFPMKI